MTNPKIREEVEQEAKKDLAGQVAGVLTALIPVLSILGYSFDWLTEEFITSLYFLLMAVGALVYNVYAIYKNHFSGTKAKKQNEALKEKGLK